MRTLREKTPPNVSYDEKMAYLMTQKAVLVCSQGSKEDCKLALEARDDLLDKLDKKRLS